MKHIAIIPARANSKSIKNKNIKILNGKPLIAYSIEVALKSNIFDLVVVSTDSQEIADIAKDYGVNVPFLRPKGLAKDMSLDREYIIHALDWYETNKKYIPDTISILRPTTPNRLVKIIKEALNKFISKYDDGVTSLCSVQYAHEPVQKMLKVEKGWLVGFFPEDKRVEYFNLPRQMFPKSYVRNGYIDIVKTTCIRNLEEGIFGKRILPFLTDPVIDIDFPSDFKNAELTA